MRQQGGEFDRVLAGIDKHRTSEEQGQQGCGGGAPPDNVSEPRGLHRGPVPCGFPADVMHNVAGPVRAESRILARAMGFRQRALEFVEVLVTESCHGSVPPLRETVCEAPAAPDVSAPSPWRGSTPAGWPLREWNGPRERQG